jgi:hypothetical protein
MGRVKSYKTPRVQVQNYYYKCSGEAWEMVCLCSSVNIVLKTDDKSGSMPLH